jgi:Mg-chelatase subunit ChlD
MTDVERDILYGDHRHLGGAMDHQVFISHSSRDKEAAAAICGRLEVGGLRCWMAPRDLLPGHDYALSIMDAIDASRLMLVVLSKDASMSEHVVNEIDRAVAARVPILPVKVDGFALSRSLAYYLGKTQWFDASRPPLESHLNGLVSNVQRLLTGRSATIATPGAQRNQVQPVHLEGLQIQPEQVADREEETKERLSYSIVVSRKRPACLILLVDQSFSMNFPIAGTETKKKDAVADVVNNVLYNAVLASTKEDGVRHYFDVGILSYGVDDGVKSAFDQDLVSIGWVADNPRRWVRKEWEEPDGQGGTVQMEQEMPVWLEPFAKGKTLMRSAFERTLAVVMQWTDKHPDSFPPIVLHITDGGFTDNEEDPAPVAQELQDQSTNAGGALVFNCHLSHTEGQTMMFPSAVAADGLEGRARQLHDISSPLPEPMRKEAISMGYQVEVGARGYVRNADLASLVNFLDIGTRPALNSVVEAIS